MSDAEHDGYSSRKFWITVVILVKNTALMMVGVITPEVWAPLEGAVILFFTGGNVVEKFGRR